ncbi:helix-turn-helix transcriptional regulator [Streptosporangiaceae bacterium NEAU-GS5]|nr:helix-turn-helix transcriptional regulator [Streptosporangiaceae bacterium NEAU-GS5]
MSLSTQDYRRMLDLAVALMDGTAPELDWSALTTELNDALHGTLCLFVDDLWPSGGAGRCRAWSPEPYGGAELDALVRETIGDHPLARHYIADDHDRLPAAISDVIATADWRRTRTYAILRSEVGIDEQLAVPMGDARAFLICRPPGERVSDRDRLYARGVQPLLIAAERHSRRLREVSRRIAGAPGQAADLGVTARELTVLSLVAEGLTAAAIGRRLAISRRTVTKHQENIYRKLKATDRLTAVLRAQKAGLVP